MIVQRIFYLASGQQKFDGKLKILCSLISGFDSSTTHREGSDGSAGIHDPAGRKPNLGTGKLNHLSTL